MPLLASHGLRGGIDPYVDAAYHALRQQHVIVTQKTRPKRGTLTGAMNSFHWRIISAIRN